MLSELLARLLPRFCVSQGTRANGEPKLRAVDDFSRSSINAATTACEKLHCDSLVDLFAIMREMVKMMGSSLALFKSDVDSAYRRVPLRPEHRRYAAIVYKTDEGTFVSEHYTLPFGSVGSVYGWDRVGCLIRTLARRLLKIPVLRYVDDLFGADRFCLSVRLLLCCTCLVCAFCCQGRMCGGRMRCVGKACARLPW